MADIHITRELLRAVACGDLPPRTLVELGLQHLTALCPHCRDEFLAWRRDQEAPTSYESAFRVLPVLLEQQGREMEERGAAAARDLRELLAISHEARLTKIDRAITRFRGPTLAALLLEESKRHMPAELGKVYELAEAAAAVLHRSMRGPGTPDLSARAEAYMANAHRARGNLQEARRRFDLSRSYVKHHGVTDPHVLAEVDWLEGALHMDQRRFGDAEELLTRAIALYTLADDPVQAARPMLTLGLMWYHAGNYPKAVAVTRHAVGTLPREHDPLFYLCARHNLALYLCEGGSYEAAADALHADRELYAEFPEEPIQLRLTWLEGKIAAGLGHLASAEESFRATRRSFIERGIGYDAAMISLDLALVYARQGRTGELERLAAEMRPVFQAAAVHREVAHLLVEQAARRGELTAEVLKELAAYLKAAEANPSLRVRPS